MAEAEASNDVGFPGPAGVATKEATGRWSGVTAMGPSPRGQLAELAVMHGPSVPGGVAAPVMLMVRPLFSVVISTVFPSGVPNSDPARSSTWFKPRAAAGPPGRLMPTTRRFAGSATYRTLWPAGVVAIARVVGLDGLPAAGSWMGVPVAGVAPSATGRMNPGGGGLPPDPAPTEM